MASKPIRLRAQAARGFTLIELMITVAIVAILVAIAYPSYTRYVVRSNRSAAQSFILGVANQQEQYMLDARQYATSMASMPGLSASAPAAVSNNYNVTVTASNAAVPPTYTVTATATGAQRANDAQCLDLTVDQTGTKGISGPGPVTSCW
nr:type IV pilin protein [uncultured Ralstonia sp.]